jgi:TPR repeat protein
MTMSVDDAYSRGDYATAFRLARQLADRGDAAGQYNLGIMYTKGHGVSQDYGEALKWFHLAADQEYASA